MRPKVNLGLVVLNVVGAVVYLIAASHSWAIPQERHLQSTTGEPFLWALYVLPIWGFFCLVDLTWGAIIVARRQWSGGRLWMVTALIWFTAVAIDFAHH